MGSDTIAAISTPVGEGAISIVRLSGPNSIPVVDKLFSGKDLTKVKTHTIHYGKLVDPKTKQVMEEVMVSVLRAPKTFTREDIVEINCHGGIVPANRVLQLVLENGARMSEPGEFTKRAFLNGRIDLSQAEAVMDLIRSQTDKAMDVALDQMDGRLSKLIQKLRQQLIETIAQVEVNIDYPEYDDIEEMSHKMMEEKTRLVYEEIERLLQVASEGKILREGLKTAIVGRPNVGKSSLLNTLVQEAKAIVTNIPGTTRDTIEEHVNIRGVPLHLIDTAGIRKTEDVVEQIGVKRSEEILQSADLVLLVLNYNESLRKEDELLLEAVRSLKSIVIINKTDLPKKLDIEKVKDLAKDKLIIKTSLVEDDHLTELEEAIANLFFSGNLQTNNFTSISNVRHIELLQKAKSSLEDAMEALQLGIPLDIVQIDVTRAWEFLGEIVGDTASEALIDQLFSQFCLGK